MIIGFLDSEIETLSDFKKFTNEFPEHEYYFYGDVLNQPYNTKSKGEVAQAVTAGLDWLAQKEVELFVLGTHAALEIEKDDLDTYATAKKYTVISIDALETHLQEIRVTVASPEKGAKRIIHLTLHNQKTDQALMDLLGGYLLQD